MRRLIAVGFLLLAAAPAAAQQSAIASRVTGALDQKLVDPECKLTGGDFKVSSGKTYLKSALESSNPDARNRMLRDGVRVISKPSAAVRAEAPRPGIGWAGTISSRAI